MELQFFYRRDVLLKRNSSALIDSAKSMRSIVGGRFILKAIGIRFTPKKKILLAVVHAVLAVVLIVAVILILRRSNEPKPHRAAIVTNGIECAAIARKMLDSGGSVADAAIAALLCEGVASPQSTGLGGGFVMTIFHKKSNKVETLIARDVAPLKATEDMFVNKTVTGGLAVSVPGELKGYWELHQRYGKLEWSELFKPVIELCRKGHLVSPYLANILRTKEKIIRESETLAEVYINPKTNEVYQEGDLVKRDKLADTLEIIQNEGVKTMYGNGTIAKLIVQDIQDASGIVTIEDLLQYNVRWEKPISANVKDKRTIHTLSLPGSGPLVTFILNVLNEYLDSEESVLALHRITEAFKFAYAKRTELGDDKFVESAIQVVRNLTNYDFAMEIRKQIVDSRTFSDYKHYGANFSSEDDHGTSHINIIAPNGDAIAATGTINNVFGCKIISRHTGIILNDGMDDFSIPGKKNGYVIPPSPSNFIKPRKMPLSSMCPTIMLDENNNVELMLGAAGGSKITSSVAYVLLRYLYFNEPIETAVHAPRIHHQLAPMQLDYESGFKDDLINGLRAKGHDMYLTPSDSGFAALTTIGRCGNQLIPVYDHRRRGGLEIIE